MKDLVHKTVGLLGELVSFESVSARSNLDLIEHITAYLADFGVEAKLSHDPTGERANLFATIGPLDVAALFAALTPDNTARERRAVALKAVKGSVTAFCSVISCRTPQPLPIERLSGSADSSSRGRESA